MIRFSDVTKVYGGSYALGSPELSVSGTISAGGITSIVGANGAGKSTLLTIIGRLLTPTSGKVEVGGLDVATAPSVEVARRMAILRQDNHITARLRVRELVGMGRFPHSGGRLTKKDVEAVEAAMGFLDLTDLADRFIDEMSGGQRQRAFIAMVLAQDAEYILLDEPLNNLDMQHSVQMMQQLRSAADELGRTVVLVMHDLNFAAAWSDEIMAMKDGQIVAHGPIAEIMQPKLLTHIFSTPVQVVDIDGRLTALYSQGRACPPGDSCGRTDCVCDNRFEVQKLRTQQPVALELSRREAS